MFKMKNENFKKDRGSHADIFAEMFAEIFAGNGRSIHEEGLALECSFWKSCGIAVEFDNVFYITDIDTNRVNVLTSLFNTATTELASLTQRWSSTVDVYTRSDIEAHKLVPGC